jgi:hypothetical protein
MAKVTSPVNEKLISVFSQTPPANPAPTPADKAYLIGLKKKGYKEAEIIEIAAKAGFLISPELFITKSKK